MSVNPKTMLVIVGLVTTLTQSGSGRPDPGAPLPPAAAKVAQDFLFAFSRNDREAIAAMLPRRLENLYGPAPFTRMPSIAKPRADGRVGAVDFQGPMVDPGLPGRGTIILRRVEEGGVRAWRVRQIYWYHDLPPEADIPDSSPTAADRAQEPQVRQAALEFVRAWLHGEYQAMDHLTFHWWRVPRDPPRWVRMTGAELRARPTRLDGLRVDFLARLRMARLIPREVRGNIWLVQEDGIWRVRPLSFTFLF